MKIPRRYEGRNCEVFPDERRVSREGEAADCIHSRKTKVIRGGLTELTEKSDFRQLMRESRRLEAIVKAAAEDLKAADSLADDIADRLSAEVDSELAIACATIFCLI